MYNRNFLLLLLRRRMKKLSYLLKINIFFVREREREIESERETLREVLRPPTKTNSRKVSSRCEFSRTVIMLCDMICVCMCVCVLAMRRLNQITVKFILEEHYAPSKEKNNYFMMFHFPYCSTLIKIYEIFLTGTIHMNLHH